MINLAELEQQLSDLPHAKREAQKVVIQKREVLERAKLLLSVKTASETLKATGENAQAKKACATIETEKEQTEVIEAQIELDKAQAEFDYLEDRFVSLRKIASLEQENMKLNISGF